MAPIRPENLARYPPDWDNISDVIRFGRAGGRCECFGECDRTHADALGVVDERCQAVHAEVHPTTGSRVWLTTAHLDNTPENSDNPDGVFIELPLERSNLRAMCQRCHLNHDRHIHVANAAVTREVRKEQLGLW